MDTLSTVQEVSVMGGSVEKGLKRTTKALISGGLSEKKVQQAIEKPVRTGASAARRDIAKQTAEAAQKEQTRLLEAESDIARRRAGAGARGAGRGSLIRSSPTGLATNLGGT